MEKRKGIKGIIIYIITGIIAILTLYPTVLPAVEAQLAQLDELGFPKPPLSVEQLTMLSLVQPFILLLLALTVGFLTAHKVGLTSVMIHSNQTSSAGNWRNGINKAMILGIVLGIFIIVFDLVFKPLLPDVFAGTIQAPTILSFISALLYGGIVEELMLRFGLMSLLVFVFWKLFNRKQPKPSNWVYITAILISAFLFALGHYGATAALTEMTAFVWIRMILLNGFGGFFFGWIYWRYNLEMAMVSHMFAHISMNLLMLILSLFL